MTEQTVEVPQGFREIGFSGVFWLDAVAKAVPMWRRMVPCLLGNSDWMALRVNNDDTVTLVRKDAAAIWDVTTGAPRLAPVLPVPLDVDDWVTTPSRETSWMTGSDPRAVAHQMHRRGELRADLTRCGRRIQGQLIRASTRMPRCRICAARREARS